MANLIFIIVTTITGILGVASIICGRNRNIDCYDINSYSEITEWTCYCGQKNTGNYCTNYGEENTECEVII